MMIGATGPSFVETRVFRVWRKKAVNGAGHPITGGFVYPCVSRPPPCSLHGLSRGMSSPHRRQIFRDTSQDRPFIPLSTPARKQPSIVSRPTLSPVIIVRRFHSTVKGEPNLSLEASSRKCNRPERGQPSLGDADARLRLPGPRRLEFRYVAMDLESPRKPGGPFPPYQPEIGPTCPGRRDGAYPMTPSATTRSRSADSPRSATAWRYSGEW